MASFPIGLRLTHLQGTDIDWAYESVNQTYGGGKTQTLRAGKALGGTSAINGKDCAFPLEVK